MRIAYYGSKGPAFREDYTAALDAWDSDEAWNNGGRIQIQISRSKRVLPEAAHADLGRAQRMVVDELDKRVENLRNERDTAAWGEFYNDLYRPKRDQIHGLLFWLAQHLALAQQPWLVRSSRKIRHTTLTASSSPRSRMGLPDASRMGPRGTWIRPRQWPLVTRGAGC